MRIEGIKTHLQTGTSGLLQSQGVRLITGTARFVSPHAAEVDTVDGAELVDFDIALIATGSRPRIPEWCEPDGDRILTTTRLLSAEGVPAQRHDRSVRA